MDGWAIEYSKTFQETDVMVVLSQADTGKWRWTLIDLDADGEEVNSSAAMFDTPEQAGEIGIRFYEDEWLPLFQATGDRTGP